MSLFDFISEMKLRQSTAKLPLARHDTCHAVLDSIALRKHDIQRLFLICAKKNANSNLHVMGIICHWMSNLSFFPCTFTITDLSDSRRNPKKMEVTVCGSFIHRTLCWIYLFSSDRLNCAASIVRARYSTNSNLNQGITKRPDIFIFAKFSYRQRNPLMKNFKTKKKYLYHLGNFNSPLSTSNVCLEPGIESNSIVCAFLFGSG